MTKEVIEDKQDKSAEKVLINQRNAFTADVYQPWTDLYNYYFEYLIIRSDYLITPFDYLIIEQNKVNL